MGIPWGKPLLHDPEGQTVNDTGTKAGFARFINRIAYPEGRGGGERAVAGLMVVHRSQRV
ncbi:MAG: hypothetical protein ACE5NA_01955 [Nitrospiraceae bacterium]